MSESPNAYNTRNRQEHSDTFGVDFKGNPYEEH